MRYGRFLNAHRNEQPVGDALPSKLLDACRHVKWSPLAQQSIELQIEAEVVRRKPRISNVGSGQVHPNATSVRGGKTFKDPRISLAISGEDMDVVCDVTEDAQVEPLGRSILQSYSARNCATNLLIATGIGIGRSNRPSFAM